MGIEEKLIQHLKNKDRDQLEALSKKFPEEHRLAFIKAGIELIPFIGGPVATLLYEYYPNRQIERIITFLRRLADRVERLERQIKAERAQTEEFIHLFLETLRSVSRDYQQEKLEAYRAILLNVLVMPEFSPDEGEFFLTLVNELTVPHIKMLRVLAQPVGVVPADLRFQKRIDGTWLEVSIQDVLHRVFAGGPDGYVDAIWIGLQSRGLVSEANYRQRRRYNISGPRGTTHDFTAQVLADLRRALTTFGRRLIQFITDPPEATEAVATG